MAKREDRVYAVMTAALGLLVAGAVLYGVHRYLLWVVGHACQR